MDRNDITPQEIAKMIDHTLLKPEATLADVSKLCEEAKEYGFCSVCVNPSYVSFASENLQNTNVKVCTVVSFPLGALTSEMKAVEARKAIECGAAELDMVINVGALKSGEIKLVQKGIDSVVNVCREYPRILCKVILETCLLTKNEKIVVCELSKQAGADFVKTSTGFGSAGATEEDIKLMAEVVSNNMGVKASGGIRTYADAIRMISAGATRIGTSSGVVIVETPTLENIE